MNSKLFVIFDLDGTICHVNGDWDKIPDFIKPFNNVTDAASNAYKQHNTAFFENLSKIELHENPKELTGAQIIRNLTCPVFVVTNNTNFTAQECLKQFNLMVKEIIGIDNVSKAKPSDEGIMYILNKYNLNPKDGLFIGNSSADEEAAQKAGLIFLKIQELDFTDN